MNYEEIVTAIRTHLAALEREIEVLEKERQRLSGALEVLEDKTPPAAPAVRKTSTRMSLALYIESLIQTNEGWRRQEIEAAIAKETYFSYNPPSRKVLNTRLAEMIRAGVLVKDEYGMYWLAEKE